VDWVPEGQTIKQVYYKQVLTKLREQVRRRPKVGFFTKTMNQHTMPCLSGLFDEAQDRVGTSTVLT